MVRMQNGSWLGVSASTSIEFGMTSRAIPPNRTKRPEISLPPLTRNQGECGLDLHSSQRFPRMQGTMKFSRARKLTMPVLAVGGEKSFGPLQAVIMRNVATNVQEAVVGGSGHWLMEERSAETVALS